jgi:Leucine-rich repeat (LRR) protein
VSSNKLEIIPSLALRREVTLQLVECFSKDLKYFDLSFNQISMINNTMFIDKSQLKFIGMEKCLTPKIENFLFYFNDFLEEIKMNGNNLLKFPMFCSNYSLSRVCSLQRVDFRDNKLKIISKKDLLSLKNLKFINFEGNLIETIEPESFDSLQNLETLSLASNRLSNFSVRLFDNLLNIKDLNLSSNIIEILSENLFHNLNKLVTIDLSSNRIYSIRNNSFDSLFNLKNLHLNNNSNHLVFESALSFNKLDSLVNIYITKDILTNIEANKCFFKQFSLMKDTHHLSCLKFMSRM